MVETRKVNDEVLFLVTNREFPYIVGQATFLSTFPFVEGLSD